LCSGDVFPGHWLGWTHWLHRWLGVLLLGFFLHLARTSRRGALAGVGAVVAGLAVAQVSLGILAVLLRLPIAVRATHAVVAYALWALLVWIAVRAGAWRGAAEGEPSDTNVGRGAAEGEPSDTNVAFEGTAARQQSMGPE
jgi:fused signal recognition particle receptor